MAKAAFQTYSFGDLADQELPEILAHASRKGFIGVETYETHGYPVAQVRALLDDLGLEVAGAHYDFPVGTHAEQTLDALNELRSPYSVWSLEPEEFESVDLIKRGVERINEAAANAATRGVKIAVHNHGAEFLNTFDGRYAYEYLKELVVPEVDFEFDMYWAALAGADVARVIAGLGDRVHHLHVKDGPLVTTDDILTPLGEGKVPVRAALEANPAVEWHIVELDRAAISMYDAVDLSFDYLVELGLTDTRQA